MNTLFFTLLLFGIDDAIIVPALIAAFTSLAGTTASTISNRRNQNKQIQAQKELNEQNHQYFLENREYNEPANQMQRLMDAGISPFGQSFGNSSASAFSAQPVGTTDDLFGNIAQGFSNAAKTGMDTYLAQKQQKIVNELQNEKLKITQSQVNELKRFHNMLDVVSNKKIDLGYFTARNNYDIGLKGISQRVADREAKYSWLNHFYSDTGMLGTLQAQNIANQIGWRDKLNPYTVDFMNERNRQLSTYNQYYPTLLSQQVRSGNLRNNILLDQANVSRNDWRIYKAVYPQKWKQAMYEAKWGRHLDNIQQNMSLYNSLLESINNTMNTVLDFAPSGKFGLGMYNLRHRNLTDF